MQSQKPKNSFEKDTKSSVKFVRAYGIDEENERAPAKEALRFPNKTFKKVVPEVLEKDNVDILVLQGGSIEISNIKVNEAVLDIHVYSGAYANQVAPNQVDQDPLNGPIVVLLKKSVFCRHSHFDSSHGVDF